MKYAVELSCCTAALHLAVKHAGETFYGKPAASHGALEGKKVFCSDMTFDATLNPVVYKGGALDEDGKPLAVGMDIFHHGLYLPNDIATHQNSRML